jgi:hypothetical protein
MHTLGLTLELARAERLAPSLEQAMPKFDEAIVS